MYRKEELIQPFSFRGGKSALLLIHGFTACPVDLRPLAESFREWGYTLTAPLLSGHGSSPEKLKETSWEDWAGEAAKALTVLRKNCTRVAAVGHSMGGLIALMLAARREVDAVVSINAPMVYCDADLHKADSLLGKQDYVLKPRKNTEISVNREGLPHFSYIRVPVESFVSLNKAISAVGNELEKIECPALIVQSENDKTVHPVSAEIINRKINHSAKEVIIWPNEDHHLPLSCARKELAAAIKEFLTKYQIC